MFRELWELAVKEGHTEDKEEGRCASEDGGTEEEGREGGEHRGTSSDQGSVG